MQGLMFHRQACKVGQSQEPLGCLSPRQEYPRQRQLLQDSLAALWRQWLVQPWQVRPFCRHNRTEHSLPECVLQRRMPFHMLYTCLANLC